VDLGAAHPEPGRATAVKPQPLIRALSALRASLTSARALYNAAHPRLELAFPGKKGLIRSFYWRDELKRDDAPKAETKA
jgi:hypothetical protein